MADLNKNLVINASGVKRLLAANQIIESYQHVPVSDAERYQERKDSLVKLCVAGASKKRLLEEDPYVYCKESKVFSTLLHSHLPVRDHMTRGVYVWGASGSGKTSLLRQRYPDAYWKDSSKWWQGYDQQGVVIWDDFDPRYHSLTLIKRLLCHSPFQVPVKRSYINFKSSLLILVSSTPLSECYVKASRDAQHSFRSRLQCFRVQDYQVYPLPSPLWEERYGLHQTPDLPLVVDVLKEEPV